MSAHEHFADEIPAYALEALDRDDARRVADHLATCAACQAELARYRQVTGSLGLAIDPEVPPPSLRARTLARAVAQPQTSAAPGADSDAEGAAVIRPAFGVPQRGADATAHTPRQGTRWPWLAFAASVMAIVGLSAYAWMLSGETASLRQQLAEALDRAAVLRDELVNVRRDSARLLNATNVVNARDLVTVNLSGQQGAPAASGRALVSTATGLIFRAQGLPSLQPGRVYQLWIIPPAAPGAPAVPIGAGVLMADASGEFVLQAGPLPSSVPAVQVVAVTDEPGPAGSPGPTTPILLVGQVGS